MGSLGSNTEATLHFGVPDFSVSAEERGFFAFPAYKSVSKVKIPLRDARTDPDITLGPKGLDAQGFTYINHRSFLADGNQWFEGDNVETIYLQECEQLIRLLTGAKRTVAINCSFRRRLVNEQSDPTAFVRRGCEIDENLAKLPRDRCTVLGKTPGSAREPARIIHVDYSVEGLKDTARYCRKDITEAGREALAAEDAGGKAPRYAAYSVWRPISTVKRDPLVVCDWRSITHEDLVAIKYRNPSSINESGDFIMTAYNAKPPQEPVKQKWYWMPEQNEDEVLVIKFADTASESDPAVAAHCAHGSPFLPGTEGELPRESVEFFQEVKDVLKKGSSFALTKE